MTYGHRSLGILLGVVGLACLGFRAAGPVGDDSAPAGRPALAVVVIFDQMRGDYLPRWQELFGDGGFRRLLTEGASFPNCHYPYSCTVTGSGHASLLTGCCPNRHGIVGNDWYDRKEARSAYCAATDRYELVPRIESLIGKKVQAGTPDRLLAPTLADALKSATGGRAKVVNLSLKDRSSVLPGGRRPDACYWFESTTGQAVTSTYYRDVPHAWVARFNAERFIDRWAGHDWTRLRPDLDYVRYSGPDDSPGEGIGVLQGRTFPHPIGTTLPLPGKIYHEAMANSPFGNDVLLELTRRAIDAEQLGKDDIPDLLTVSFSSNDLIGHTWGPDSQEVLDVTLRSDLIVRDLLTFLDDRVGRGRYVLALSADHGVCPLPEVLQAQGKDAERIVTPFWDKRLEAHLTETFGKPDNHKGLWLEAYSHPWFYLEPRSSSNPPAARVEQTAADWFRAQPEILTAYTRTQLLHGLPPDDVIGQRVRRSFHPERCGDVIIVTKPYYLPSGSYLTGTTHGTPHAYDTHVPLVVYGPGIRAGSFSQAVTPQAIAAILAHCLEIPPPACVDAPVPRQLCAVP